MKYFKCFVLHLEDEHSKQAKWSLLTAHFNSLNTAEQMYFWKTVLLESSFKSFSIASFDVLEKRFSSALGLSIVFSWANRGGWRQIVWYFRLAQKRELKKHHTICLSRVLIMCKTWRLIAFNKCISFGVYFDLSRATCLLISQSHSL